MQPGALGYRSYRWIFAPGLADGEFPGGAQSNPLLSGQLVDLLNRRIYPRRLMSPRDRNRRELLFLFLILDSASEQVTLSFPGSTLEGQTVYPSSYIAEICRHYSTSPVTPLERVAPVRERGDYLRRAAEQWRSGALAEDAARNLLSDDVVRRAKLESMGLMRADIGRGVLGSETAWHPSELNSLAACPFVFLARHRLKLRAFDLADFEVPAAEVGILAHRVLREFYAQQVPIHDEEARHRMEKIIMECLADADNDGEGPYSVFDPALWQIRRRQLVSALLTYVEFAIRDAIDGFQTRPEYLEKPLPQARLGRILLAGKPDHVAVHRTGGHIDAIRIDDFKYSAASRTTTRQLEQSLQIPIYAYLARQALGAGPHIHIEGRYLLLRSPSNPVVSHIIDDRILDAARTRIEKLVDKVFDGSLHPDPADRQDCPDCDYRRLCRISGG
jgi:ATP-dependent helicase/DNAse subunit B